MLGVFLLCRRCWPTVEEDVSSSSEPIVVYLMGAVAVEAGYCGCKIVEGVLRENELFGVGEGVLLCRRA